MKIAITAISTALAFAVVGQEAQAAPKKPKAAPLSICSTLDGTLVARPKCRKKETSVTTAGLAGLVPAIKGADGPQGPQGPQGPAGASGPAGVANLEYKTASTPSGSVPARTVLDVPIGPDIVIPASADVEVSCDGKDIIVGARCEPVNPPTGFGATQETAASGKSVTCSYVNNTDAPVTVKAIAICAPGLVDFLGPLTNIPPLVLAP